VLKIYILTKNITELEIYKQRRNIYNRIRNRKIEKLFIKKKKNKGKEYKRMKKF
jgi:hypothetical protein